MDNVNRKDDIGNTLNDSMQNLFNDHAAGILIAEGKSYVVIYHGEKYYFTDSFMWHKRYSSQEFKWQTVYR